MPSIIHNKLKGISKEDIADAYQSVFKSAKGKIVLLHMADIGHLDSSTFSPCPITMARMEGERRFVLEVLDRMGVNVLNLLTDVDLDGNIQLEEQEDDSII